LLRWVVRGVGDALVIQIFHDGGEVGDGELAVLGSGVQGVGEHGADVAKRWSFERT